MRTDLERRLRKLERTGGSNRIDEHYVDENGWRIHRWGVRYEDGLWMWSPPFLWISITTQAKLMKLRNERSQR